MIKKLQRQLHFLASSFSLFFMVFCSVGCGHSHLDKELKTSILQKLRVGIQVSPAMTLVMVAEDKGFFDRAGIDVELKEFTAGKFALQAFLGGSLDLAVSGEVPVTLSTLQG